MPPETEVRDTHTYKILKRGSVDGQLLLEWLAGREADTASSVAMMAWALSWIIANAPDEDAQKIMEALMKSMCIYSKFFEDMNEEDRQAGGLRH